VAVHFVSIEPARDWGASTTIPLFGALTGTHVTALLNDPLPELVWLWHFDRAARTCRFTARRGDFAVDLPMNPMHGTVGVAPAMLEVRSALVPDAFGGNMGTREMRAGTTCYLGVNVPGALLSLGDGTPARARGETCGVAVETAMDAYQLVTQAIESPLANVCDPNYTSVAKMPKAYLPVRDAMGGAHARCGRSPRAMPACRPARPVSHSRPRQPGTRRAP
jgi:acetamidase/formamidase